MVTYQDLIIKNGGVYNIKTGQGYSSPELLAKDMGLSVMPENWHTNIQTNNNWQYQAQPTATPTQPVAPVVQPVAIQPKPISYAAPTSKKVEPAPVVKNYVRNPAGMDVYDTQGNYISAEKAASIPNFWEQVEISDQAPNTSKGAGLGGPVSGLNDGLQYITYNGTDVYEKATGKYVDFDTAKKLDIWNKIETAVDTEKLKELGIDPNGETPQFKNEDLKKEYEATISPYQAIYNDFKASLQKMNDKLEQAWLDYNLAVIDIEENPWLLTGEVTQELNKLKRKSLAKIDALTSSKQAMLDEFNLAVGITEKEEAWKSAQKKEAETLTPEEQSAQDLAEYEAKLKLEKKYKEPEKPTTTADITEYEYAKSQGYTGTFEQWTKAKSSSASTVYAAGSLDELAKLGYTRRHSVGLGWDFFYNGKPISAKEISQRTGTGMDVLLAGSDNPKDIKILQGLKVPSASSDDLFNQL